METSKVRIAQESLIGIIFWLLQNSGLNVTAVLKTDFSTDVGSNDDVRVHGNAIRPLDPHQLGLWTV